jgi:hypothetical protein
MPCVDNLDEELTMPRFLFSLVVVLHGLLHCLHWNKAWRLASTQIESPGESRFSASVWLFPAVAFTVFGIALNRSKAEWHWMLGIMGIVISQSLILIYWHDAMYGTIVNGTILVIGWLFYQSEKNERSLEAQTIQFLSSQPESNTQTIVLDNIQHLPLIVQRWMIRSNVIGIKPIQRARLTQRGQLRTKPDGRWMPMEAQQLVTLYHPGFLWQATIDAGAGMTITGLDKYQSGQGSMIIRALNAVTIAKSSGAETDQGSMMRYLAEIVWSPTAALNDQIRWEYVSENSARAVMHHSDTAVSGLFSFNTDGDVIAFEGKRYAEIDNRYSLENWLVTVLEYKNFNGIRIPSKSEVTWRFKTGDFTWLKVEVTGIENNFDLRSDLKLNSSTHINNVVTDHEEAQFSSPSR